VRRVPLGDVVAGLSVAVVLVPQSIAYAQLAGFPASRGLFAAAIPPLVAAPFASSPYLQPGPTAITALLTFSALTPLAEIGSAHYVELGLLLALLVGLIRVAVGVLRAGVLADLLSQPLLDGFVPAAAILIVCSQLPIAVGVDVHGRNNLYGATGAPARSRSPSSPPPSCSPAAGRIRSFREYSSSRPARSSTAATSAMTERRSAASRPAGRR
jgi:MFS superfamily sulfate permease-like transporter